MGKVLSNLFSEKEKDLGFIIDFENAKPSGEVTQHAYLKVLINDLRLKPPYMKMSPNT
jgi:hypothetical protein